MYNSNTFLYDGVSSTTLGLFLCKVGTADSEEIFVSDRSIVNEVIQKNGKTQNYFYKVEKKPLKFKIDLFLDGTWTDTKARDVARFFFKDKYCEFIPDDTNRIYVCMPIGNSQMFAENTSGYFSIEFECVDEYSRSAIAEVNYDYSTSTSLKTFTFNNTGDVLIFPYIELTNTVSNSTLIVSNTTTGKAITFKTDASGNPLIANELITIDCEKEIITTNQLGLYRYSNMEGIFIDLAQGNNTITVSGKCKIKLKYRFQYMI